MVTSNENANSDDLDQKIVTQVEYYFGDINIKQDKFIKYHISQNDGWFPLDKLLTFKRLKNLTEDKDVIIESVKKSGLVEVSECGTKLRRTKPLPEESEEYVKELNLRTLHLKGFPKDSTLEQIQSFCAEFGTVESIQMRKNFKKNMEFKGCIFVTYANKEDASKVIELPELKYNDIELLRENKEKYFERKKAFYDSLKKKKGENDASKPDLVQTEGAILKITGFNVETKFAEIKEELSKHSKVAFVSSVNEQSQCFVRFAEENGAKTTLKLLKEKESDDSEEQKVSLELLGQKVKAELVSDEEEKEFWREFKARQSNTGFKRRPANKWQKGKKRSFEGGSNWKSNKVSKASE